MLVAPHDISGLGTKADRFWAVVPEALRANPGYCETWH
jgi:hypothetical protein